MKLRLLFVLLFAFISLGVAQGQDVAAPITTSEPSAAAPKAQKAAKKSHKKAKHAKKMAEKKAKHARKKIEKKKVKEREPEIKLDEGVESATDVTDLDMSEIPEEALPPQ
jgi:Ni/Co efflux regulator RcnB